MNQRQKQILKILQSEFPLTKRPYQTLAVKLGMGEAYVISYIKDLKKRGYLRRVGAVASSKHLGYKSTLIGAKLNKKYLNKNIEFINSYDSITHNYLRDAQFNVWFTFNAKSRKDIDVFIRKFKKRRGVSRIIDLPAEKTFKIKAEFDF